MAHHQAAAGVQFVDDALAVNGRAERPAHFRLAEHLAIEVEAKVEQHFVGDDAHLLRRALSQRVAVNLSQQQGAQTIQEGIGKGSLPLLFRLGYDIRGVTLTGSWQDAVSPLGEIGEYILLGGTLVSLSAPDAALLRVLPIRPQGEEFIVHFSRSQTPRVFAELLPFLQYSQAVVMEEALQERLHKHPLKARVYLDREGNGIAARVAFSYGEWSVDPFQFNQNLPAYLLRDALGERQVVRLPEQYTVSTRSGLVGELRALLGQESVVL